MSKRIIIILLAITLLFSAVPSFAVATDISDMTAEQRVALNMLNYIIYITQKINNSTQSRLLLNQYSSELRNNLYFNSIDSRTQVQVNNLLDSLENYKMIDKKSERLNYIYEQNRAQAIRSSIPNPLGLLSAVQSFDLGKLVASVVYMAVDTAANYQNNMSAAEQKYLQDGWALSDEADKVLAGNQKTTFNYLVQIINENNISADYALTEQRCETFFSYINDTNYTRRIQKLESAKDVYSSFGQYWLALAEAYYHEKNYQLCLDAVSSYESINTRTFYKDYDYAKILPLAIISAGEVYSTEEYCKAAEKYCSLILDNCDEKDWSIRYFVVQTYVDLCSKTGFKKYAEDAYNIVFDNVTNLVDEQITLNSAYLSPVKTVDPSSSATKDEKKEIENYNKLVKEERKAALPPLSNALTLNCDLLFALCEELDKPDSEKAKISNIFLENGQNIFMIKPISLHYSFDSEMPDSKDIEIEYKGDTLKIPVMYVDAESKIKVSVESADSNASFADWVIDNVDRHKSDDYSAFTAEFKSPAAKKYKFADGDKITIEISHPVAPEIVLHFEYVVSQGKNIKSILKTFTRVA